MGTRFWKQFQEYAQFFIYDTSERAERQRRMAFNLAIATVILVVLYALKLLISSRRKRATQSKGRVPRKAGTGLRLLTLAEYEANMRRTTEREKQKLYSSAEYKQVLEDKGSDPINWNWQIREQ